MNINTQEILDFGRSHTGRALSLFSILAIFPGVSWHDAAIAAASISIYAFWVRCEANAEPGETGADVFARSVEERTKGAAQVAAAIARIPMVREAIGRHPKIEGAIGRFLPVVEEDAIEVAPALADLPPAPIPPKVVLNSGKGAKEAIAAN